MTPAQKKAFAERMAAHRARKAAGGMARGGSSTSLTVYTPPASKAPVTYLATPPPPPKPASAKPLSVKIKSDALVTAVEEKELLNGLLTAGAIGYADQEGWFQELPLTDSIQSVVPIGNKGVFALFSYLGAKYVVKDPWLRKILMTMADTGGKIAMYELTKAWTAKKQLEKLTTTGAGEGEGEDGAGV